MLAVSEYNNLSLGRTKDFGFLYICSQAGLFLYKVFPRHTKENRMSTAGVTLAADATADTL